MNRADRATIEFTLSWQSGDAVHHDRLYQEKVDFWRDIFPGALGADLALAEEGETVVARFKPGVLVPSASAKNIRQIRRHQFGLVTGGPDLVPELGRFYPSGVAWGALDCYPQSCTPFRVVDIDDDLLTVDLNHPLADSALTLHCTVLHRLAGSEQRGGSLTHIPELVTLDGPGMQVPHGKARVSFFPDDYPLARENEAPDHLYYQEPRMVQHLDSTAIGRIENLHARLLADGMRVLDLMSSWTSHLPGNLARLRVIGLGMNSEELAANPALTGFLVHDLNQQTLLPLQTDSFDAALCTVSIEYLVRPVEILQEVARVVRPGGLVLIVFSDRWFVGKQILPWGDLHSFERLGLVLEYFRRAGGYTHLESETIRGLPRPEQDKYFRQRTTADPIYAVWARVIV